MLLYLHSYQSLLWNTIVSERIKKYGLNPIIGDLVFKDNAMKNVPLEIIDDEEEENNESNKKFPVVETISEENLDKYTIFDVVYPLPGCDVRYPENEIGKWYIDLLAKDELTSEKLMKKNKYSIFSIFFMVLLPYKYYLFTICSIFRLFSLKGTYRTIVSKAENIVWSTINHNDLNDDLLLSDIEVMENKQPFTSIPGMCS